MTAESGAFITPSQFNVHVRDNLLETEAGRALIPSSMWFADGPHRVSERQVGDSIVDTSETTASESFTDLDTYGPSVKLNLVDIVLVMVNSQILNASTNAGYASYEIESELEGVFSSEPNRGRALIKDGGTTNESKRFGVTQVFQGLNGAGRYAVTMKYATSASASNSTFVKRRLQVMAL